MNIFFLDWNVTKCAQQHLQILCSAHHMTEQVTDQVTDQVPYKLSHKNHPCCIWVRTSMSNYLYLCELGLELCYEYTYRYGKRHKSQDVIEWCVINKPNIPDIGFTEPPKAMPDEFKVKDVVESYRNYYRGPKSKFATWKGRNIPDWFLTNFNNSVLVESN
jgi:hypothetical protein